MQRKLFSHAKEENTFCLSISDVMEYSSFNFCGLISALANSSWVAMRHILCVRLVFSSTEGFHSHLASRPSSSGYVRITVARSHCALGATVFRILASAGVPGLRFQRSAEFDTICCAPIHIQHPLIPKDLYFFCTDFIRSMRLTRFSALGWGSRIPCPCVILFGVTLVEYFCS